MEQGKPNLENWQKYMENGEYLRSSEINEEQNYNMIDGRRNNGKKKKGRSSVLAKLWAKQAEIAKRNGKTTQQMSAVEDMEVTIHGALHLAARHPASKIAVAGIRPLAVRRLFNGADALQFAAG